MRTIIKIFVITLFAVVISTPQSTWAQGKKVQIPKGSSSSSSKPKATTKPASKPKSTPKSQSQPKTTPKTQSQPKHQAAYPSNVETESFSVNGITFKMVKVQGGTFTMGATAEQGGVVTSDEKPAHEVTLSSFSIGQTEVTQELWEAVMGSNPSYWKGSKLPVEQVSWNDCQEFVKKLNALTGQKFRLPSEAEWEYAARGDSQSRGYKYSGSNNIDDVAWYDGNSDKTHAVATKQPNELGIYDMSGNVLEWCQDWYGNYTEGA